MATKFQSGHKTRSDSVMQISSSAAVTSSSPGHHELTELSVVDINASLAASAPMISSVMSSVTAPPASASLAPGGVGTGAGPGGGGGFTNLFNLANSTDLTAVAYNSYTQNVRCKSPPTLVDNLKNGTIG